MDLRIFSEILTLIINGNIYYIIIYLVQIINAIILFYY